MNELKWAVLGTGVIANEMALAEEKGLVLAEAMTIWHMPLYKKLWQIVESGQIGRPQMITMNFGSFKDYDMTNRFFNMSLAGGAMLDIGVYALSIVRSFMCESPDQILSQMKPAIRPSLRPVAPPMRSNMNLKIWKQRFLQAIRRS